MTFAVDHGSSTPVFQQLVDQVVAGARQGHLVPGTRLPSVRALAAELGVAAATVAKAYRQLEAEGHVATRGRNGTVVLDPAGAQADPAVADSARELAVAARAAGLSLEQTIGVLRHRW